MKSFLMWLRRTLAEVAESERGELLSVRDKTHALEARHHFRHVAEADRERTKSSH
jgi:hypothetical protein